MFLPKLTKACTPKSAIVTGVWSFFSRILSLEEKSDLFTSTQRRQALSTASIAASSSLWYLAWCFGNGRLALRETQRRKRFVLGEVEADEESDLKIPYCEVSAAGRIEYRWESNGGETSSGVENVHRGWC